MIRILEITENSRISLSKELKWQNSTKYFHYFKNITIVVSILYPEWFTVALFIRSDNDYTTDIRQTWPRFMRKASTMV